MKELQERLGWAVDEAGSLGSFALVKEWIQCYYCAYCFSIPDGFALPMNAGKIRAYGFSIR
jgi:hypothetical protein